MDTFITKIQHIYCISHATWRYNIYTARFTLHRGTNTPHTHHIDLTAETTQITEIEEQQRFLLPRSTHYICLKSKVLNI